MYIVHTSFVSLETPACILQGFVDPKCNTLHFTYNRALVNYDLTITAQDSKRYASKPYPFQAPDLQYYEHQPYITFNGTLCSRVKRHVPDSPSYEQAIAGQQFPLSEAVHKMETQ